MMCPLGDAELVGAAGEPPLFCVGFAGFLLGLIHLYENRKGSSLTASAFPI